MKELLKNRKVAIGITIVLVLLSIVFGAHRSLNAQAHTAESMINNPGADGYSVQQNLDLRIESAAIMLNMVNYYLPERTVDAESLQTAITDLRTADTIRAKAEANQRLTDAVEQVCRMLRGQRMSQADTIALEEHYSRMADCNQSIRDNYNKAAIAYNTDILGKFPGNVLKKIAMVSELPTF